MITLLSDFGLQDAYVAAMKGVIAQIAPRIPMCDITHLIPPQDILAARFNLRMACPYFPTGTVHLAVVDPGVGSRRRAIALQTSQAFFVGPDNGLFGGVLEDTLKDTEVIAAVSLTTPKYWRTDQPSTTFHGRDIFAPTAAYLASGVPILELGDRIHPSTLVQLDLPPCTPSSLKTRSDSQIICTGSLQYIDSFGNLVSNIPQQWVPTDPPSTPWEIQLETTIGPQRFPGVRTYSDVPVGTLAALVGSHGWVEVACNSGSAQSELQFSARTPTVMVGNTVSLRTVSP